VSLWPDTLQNAIVICVHRQGNMSLRPLAQAISRTGMYTLSRDRTVSRGKTLPLGLLGIFPTSFRFNSSFAPCSPWTSPMYHGRRASVPSSPSCLHPSRHRRLSEPFNTPSTPRSNRSLDPHISGSGPSNGMHLVPTKIKDQAKPILFKTELCRSWEEKGSCRYGYGFVF